MKREDVLPRPASIHRRMALVGLLATVSCDGGGEPVVVVETSALSSTFHRLLHDDPPGGCDTRDYSGDGDWFPKYCKTECAAPATGISSSFATTADCENVLFNHGPELDPGPGPSVEPEFTHLLACNNNSSPAVAVGSGYTLVFGAEDDRHFPTVGYDWASGLRKGECDNSSAITAVASDHYQTGDGDCFNFLEFEFYDGKFTYGIQGARCSPLASPPGSVAVASSCQVLDFTNRSVNEAGGGTSWVGTDWDYGYHKGECGPGRFIKGIAHPQLGAGSGRATKILCCSVSYTNLP